MSQQHGSQGMPLHTGQFPIGLSLPEGLVRPYGSGYTSAGAPLFMPDTIHLAHQQNMLNVRDFQTGQLPSSLLIGHPQSLRHPGLVTQSSGEQLNSLGSITTATTSSQNYLFSPGSHQVQAPDSTTEQSPRHQPSQSDIMMPGNITIKREVASSPILSMANGGLSSQVQYNQLTSTGGQSSAMGTDGMMFSAHSSLPMTKHICAVCGDRASGKHYGVYSCEGCKGFFKRTIRKDLTYTCRDGKHCMIDKRQRNRCQYCRYHKCLSMGMKREAVQDERQKNKEKEDGEAMNPNDDMPVDKILEAELVSEPKMEQVVPFEQAQDQEQADPVSNICKAADRQLVTLVEWAKRIPHFSTLSLDDQVILLRAGWNELLIASFSHLSINVKDSILLASGLHVHRHSAHQAGVGPIFDRVLTELVSKMRDMVMDKTELGCLRAIVLFNPDVKNLSDSPHIESLREKVYASLEAYCRSKYPEQPGRFAKLLLRLPALRSIGLKCLEHLFFFKLIGDTPIDKFLMDMLETSAPETSSRFISQPAETYGKSSSPTYLRPVNT